MKNLIIIGCGPKAIAIATKAHVLKNLGWDVPSIQIIDKYGPAANWDGTNGHTGGDTILGTTPLEDLGFPYASPIDASVDQEMLKYSYMAYKIDIGKYAEWVDRALYSPTHAMLADYYKWAVKKINAPLTIGSVTSISKNQKEWIVEIEDKSGKKDFFAEGLLITGPGEPYKFPRENIAIEGERIFNGQNFWHNFHQFKDLQNAKIAVIGGGETSAGIVTGLLNVIDKSSNIEIVTQHPILFTRNENWMEVMYFSAVMDWSELSKQEKLEIIHHADRGTFSVAAKNLLDSAYNVSMKLGKAVRIEGINGKLALVLYGNKGERREDYDYIIEATGFNPYSFIKLFKDKSLFEKPHSISERIEQDLSVKGISPKLHIPGLAAIEQGPGFPNLSCLGLLADRVLASYIAK